MYGREYSLKEEELKRLKRFLLEGYTPENIIDSYGISMVLNLDMEDLLYKKEAGESELGVGSEFLNRYDVNRAIILEYAHKL